MEVTKDNTSLASEILHDLKQTNTTLKVLLGLSVLLNIMIVRRR